MNPDQLFEAYSQAHNIKLTLDGAGAARLAFDQACAVDIQYRREEETLILQSSLTLPPTAEPRLIRALLAANLFAGPDNPILALDAAAGEIVLLFRLDAEDWRLEQFEARLQALLNEHTAWEGLIAAGSPMLDSLESADEPTPVQDFMPSPDQLA